MWCVSFHKQPNQVARGVGFGAGTPGDRRASTAAGGTPSASAPASPLPRHAPPEAPPAPLCALPPTPAGTTQASTPAQLPVPACLPACLPHLTAAPTHRAPQVCFAAAGGTLPRRQQAAHLRLLEVQPAVQRHTRADDGAHAKLQAAGASCRRRPV